MDNLIEIDLSNKDKNKLKKEFDCSMQTVRFALKGWSKSETALKIRARAKQLLKEQYDKIEA